MEIVDEWVYLGGGKYYCAQKQLACQARKPCWFALISNMKNVCLNVEWLISLFDTYFASILK